MAKIHTNKIVEQVLRDDPSTRGNDKRLQLRVWEQYGLFLTPEQRYKFLYGKLPASETIRRTRQTLQELGKYLPDKKVQEARQERAEQTRHEIVRDKTLYQASLMDELQDDYKRSRL